MLTFHVLGPLEVRSGGRPVRICGGKPRMLLATLLLEAGHVVPVDRLVEVLWPERPPPSAQANIRTYVSSLRSDLGADLIRARGAGYVIEVADDALDLRMFERLAERAEDLAAALRLWRGAPLADLPGSPLWERRLGRLHDLRLSAAERLTDALMEWGDHAAAVRELRALVEEHPFREDLWQRLMVALHRCGRKAEALRAYRELREQLVSELGVEPGAGVRRALQEILADEPGESGEPRRPGESRELEQPGGARSPAHPSGPAAPPRQPAVRPGQLAVSPGQPAVPPGHLAVPRPQPAVLPRQLPPDIPDFTGRDAALAALVRGSPLTVITGPPGVGKTALAVHGAHLLKERHPGGQIYLVLGRRDPSDVLAELLVSLGVQPPPSRHGRAGLARSLLAERPALLVLDDARDAEQVRRLLPGNGDCTVIVTSRRRITELPGALRLHLDALTPEEGLELLRAILGEERVAREPEAARAIVDACAGLPLAIRDAGARLLARPTWPLAVLMERLADGGSAALGKVRERLADALRHVPREAAKALPTLGALGTRTLPGWLVAAVLDRPNALDQAGALDLLDRLVDAHLLDPAETGPGGQPRYRIPEPVRHFAVTEQPDRAALARVLAAWTAATEHVTTRLPANVFTFPSAAPRQGVPEYTLSRLAADPLGWFEAEHELLVDSVRLAASQGLAGPAWALAAAMVPYCDLRCHFGAWRETHRAALSAARRAGDEYGQAAMLRGLGQVCLYQDRYGEAATLFGDARRIFRDLGDVRGEAAAVCGLGAVSQFHGRPADALRHFRRALGMFRTLGDRAGEAYARQAIGRVLLGTGDLERASTSLTRAMRLARELADPHREGCVSVQVGRLHQLRSEPEEAMRSQERALDLFDALGDRHCGAYAMQGLARLQAARGEWTLASARLERSCAIFKQLGDRSGEASATQMLGELLLSAGRPGQARGYLERASALRRQL
ncbi:AfsR/SARP family transcriptional regulator [Thermoactinospora rubra]|uniref:AfsR/SARP family transcriptional regulator n=1 Tax=Thermoactinospora rubra TaxID=1088767 RepID=UPI001301D87C|nr:BTAD domain-containing putative transcriptional regulator [Thermoactinospora rubra]